MSFKIRRYRRAVARHGSTNRRGFFMGRQHARHMGFRVVSRIRSILDRRGPSLACWTIVAAGLAGAAIGREPAVAIYLASFVYYGFYWQAFAWGVDSFDAFKRDAMLLKAVSVAALAFVYLQAPPDLLSLGVIALGILLNTRAAAVLGIDRTYYGRELAGLPARRVTAFPYSLMSHPMIVGNVMAFGGTLLNPAFRAAWWPLVALHVALNIGLLAMERAGPHRRPVLRLAGLLVLAVTAATATVAAADATDTSRLSQGTP